MQIIDFAGLRDYEILAGAPVLWSPEDDFGFVRSIETALNTTIYTDHCYVFRWGDERLEEFMEAYRAVIENDLRRRIHQSPERFKRVSFDQLRNFKLMFVLPCALVEMRVVPKVSSSGTFDPRQFHHDEGVETTVLRWGADAHTVEAVVCSKSLTAPTEHAVYLQLKDYYLRFCHRVEITRKPQEAAN